jgi:hypothetical protein
MKAKVKHVKVGTTDGTYTFISTMEKFIGMIIDVKKSGKYYRDTDTNSSFSYHPSWLEFDVDTYDPNNICHKKE